MIETTEKAQRPAAQCILSSELTGEQIARRPHHSPKITDSSSSKPYCPRRRWPVRRPPSWLPPGAAFSGPRRPRIHVQGQGLLRHQRPPPQGVLGLRGAHRPMGVSTHPSSPLCVSFHVVLPYPCGESQLLPRFVLF
jgi:hypothetical protein